MNYKNLRPEEFTAFLLKETEIAYEQSDIKSKSLYYSVAGTPIIKNKGVLIGLNWGGGGKNDMNSYTPQDLNKLSESRPNDYRFIISLFPFLQEYEKLNSINDINYSNLCFFRSPKVSDLSPHDWELSGKLFESYINYIQPPWILFTSIGRKPISILRNQDDIDIKEQKDFNQGNKTFTAYKGLYRQLFKLFTVPYPYQAGGISDNTRRQIWKWHFN